ncbi:MAG: hypothetical protein OEZ36_13295, partial [Spirochaetota bacterium]|nr:hypothetical protein [Spirochaetota bacterium]
MSALLQNKPSPLLKKTSEPIFLSLTAIPHTESNDGYNPPSVRRGTGPGHFKGHRPVLTLSHHPQKSPNHVILNLFQDLLLYDSPTSPQ